MRFRVLVPLLFIVAGVWSGPLSPRIARADTVSTVDRWAPLPGSPPVARSGASWAYDQTRNRLMLFGGQTFALTYLGDVWTFDLGTRTWKVVVTTGGDDTLNRYRHTAVYDTVGDRMIMYGGFTPSGTNNDVWSLDMKTLGWTKLTTSGVIPAARARHNAIYDTKRNRMVVFGGVEGTTPSDSLYALDLATLVWSHIVPVGALPEPRQAAAMIYQPDKDRLVLFGGDGQYDGELNDVWIYSFSNSSWAQLKPTGTAPLPRFDVAASYDSLSNRLIVFGGSSFTTSFNDAFALTIASPQTWTVLRPTGTTPFARGSYAAPPVAIDQRYLFFGGVDVSNNIYADTWALNLVVPSYESVPDSGKVPEARMASMAINDTAQSRMVIFGGQTGAGDFFNDSYQLRFGPPGAPALTWSSLATIGTTPTRYGAGDVYDPVNERFLVLCGGITLTPYTNDVWSLNLTTLQWSQLSPFGQQPPQRTGPACVYDSIRRRVILFGGLAANNLKLNDTWVLDLVSLTWTQVDVDSLALRPAGRFRMARADDPERNRMIISCGISDYFGPGDPRNVAFNDTWALDYNTLQWTLVPTAYDPPPRFDLRGDIIEDEERFVMFSGSVAGVNVDSNDLYSLDLLANTWSIETPQGAPPAPRNSYTMVWDKARRWLIPFGGTDGTTLLPDGGILYQTLSPGGPGTPVDPGSRPPVLPPNQGVAMALRSLAAGGADFSLRAPHDGRGRLELFSASGRRLWSTEAQLVAGIPVHLRWNGALPSGDRAPGGIYLARLLTPDGSARAKVLLLH